MKLQLIRTKGDYAAALREAERLWDAAEKSPEAGQLEVLLLIEDCDRRHFRSTAPTRSTSCSSWAVALGDCGYGDADSFAHRVDGVKR